jgi:hypothetical protein
MTPESLIEDLRSRISPAYADHPGTESWERKKCADMLEDLVLERDHMREFVAQWVNQSRLQTFQDRERFRAEAERFL